MKYQQDNQGLQKPFQFLQKLDLNGTSCFTVYSTILRDGISLLLCGCYMGHLYVFVKNPQDHNYKLIQKLNIN